MYDLFQFFLFHRCGHCKSMKPAWDTLGGEYAGSSSVLIARQRLVSGTVKGEVGDVVVGMSVISMSSKARIRRAHADMRLCTQTRQHHMYEGICPHTLSPSLMHTHVRSHTHARAHTNKRNTHSSQLRTQYTHKNATHTHTHCSTPHRACLFPITIRMLICAGNQLQRNAHQWDISPSVTLP